MYLLYDLLQIRRASFEQTLYVKRQIYQSSLQNLKDISTNDLKKATERVRDHLSLKNSTIFRLLKNIIVIEAFVSHSFNEKLRMRAQIRDVIVRYELSVFWITLNSSNLQNSLILKLIDVSISLNLDSSIYTIIRNNTATSNSMIVARFFNIVIQTFFDALLMSDSENMRILDRVVTHYVITKINKREMLHFHELIWLHENADFLNVRDRVKIDSNFFTRIIQFLEFTICQSVYEDLTKLSSCSLSSTLNVSIRNVDEEVFSNLLKIDANHVVVKKNMHKHIATCQKYDKKDCWFYFSRTLQF
jgi:hypothetical protein